MDRFLLRTKTSIAAIVTFLIAIAPQFGLQFGEEEGQLVNQAVDAAMLSFGLLATLYGRYKAGGTKLLPGG